MARCRDFGQCSLPYNGGRVLNVSATGDTVREAQARTYEAIARIRWAEGFYRRDIGRRAVKWESRA
jgi:phosphoribosylamine---glycine ligase